MRYSLFLYPVILFAMLHSAQAQIADEGNPFHGWDVLAKKKSECDPMSSDTPFSVVQLPNDVVENVKALDYEIDDEQLRVAVVNENTDIDLVTFALVFCAASEPKNVLDLTLDINEVCTNEISGVFYVEDIVARGMRIVEFEPVIIDENGDSKPYPIDQINAVWVDDARGCRAR